MSQRQIKCSKCKIEKTIDNFSPRKDSKAGVRRMCKECCATSNAQYYLKHKQRIDSRNKRYNLSNPEKVKSNNRRWYNTNRSKVVSKVRAYRSEHSERLKEYQKNYSRLRKRVDLQFKIASQLRSRLFNALKSKKKGSAVKDLGCSIAELKKHLESQFQPGMTWENWGREGWHIDHVRPLSSFNLTNPDELKRAVHYTNLQPLWAADNYRKNQRA